MSIAFKERVRVTARRMLVADAACSCPLSTWMTPHEQMSGVSLPTEGRLAAQHTYYLVGKTAQIRMLAYYHLQPSKAAFYEH